MREVENGFTRGRTSPPFLKDEKCEFDLGRTGTPGNKEGDLIVNSFFAFVDPFKMSTAETLCFPFKYILTFP